LPTTSAIEETLRRVGSQHLLLDADAMTVKFARAGIEINLGGIGKGYALDKCAEVFAEAAVADYLLHGGSSSVLARGSCAGRSDGGWSVGLRNPLRPQDYLGEIILRDRSLSTSSAAAQQFIHQGKTYGHILDPRTGWPAEGVLSATVLAPTAAEAEALSTAFYVEGLAAAQAYCAGRPDIGCVIICGAAHNQKATYETINLTESEWLCHVRNRIANNRH
jgi:thiamine biosynthesis lipoprotein